MFLRTTNHQDFTKIYEYIHQSFLLPFKNENYAINGLCIIHSDSWRRNKILAVRVFKYFLRILKRKDSKRFFRRSTKYRISYDVMKNDFHYDIWLVNFKDKLWKFSNTPYMYQFRVWFYIMLKIKKDNWWVQSVKISNLII